MQQAGIINGETQGNKYELLGNIRSFKLEVGLRNVIADLGGHQIDLCG